MSKSKRLGEGVRSRDPACRSCLASEFSLETSQLLLFHLLIAFTVLFSPVSDPEGF